MSTDWEAIRGPLPKGRMSARSTAALLDNPGCARRAVLDTSGVDMLGLAESLGKPVPFGQSPFALGQGNNFELRVKRDDYVELVRVLAELDIELPDTLQSVQVSGGSNNEARVAKTTEVLRAIAAGDTDAPNVVDHGMTKLMVGGVPVYLEQDALAFRHGDKLRICEVKGFPIVDGSAEPEKVGGAARQSAVYLASIQDTLEELGFDPGIVSSEVILICPRNYTIGPTAQVIDVERELRALRRQLDRRASVEDILADLDLSAIVGDGASGKTALEHGEELVAALPYRYTPGCIGKCDMSNVCRSEAIAADAPCALGDEAANLLGSVGTIAEALELADGAAAGSVENADVADTLQRARYAQQALLGGDDE